MPDSEPPGISRDTGTRPASTVGPQVGGEPAQPPTSPPRQTPRPTIAGRAWVAIAVAVIVLALLITFIAENSRRVTISFLGTNGTLSLGLAILIAALAGIVITLLVGSARILQLRREVRRQRRRRRSAPA